MLYGCGGFQKLLDYPGSSIRIALATDCKRRQRNIGLQTLQDWNDVDIVHKAESKIFDVCVALQCAARSRAPCSRSSDGSMSQQNRSNTVIEDAVSTNVDKSVGKFKQTKRTLWTAEFCWIARKIAETKAAGAFRSSGSSASTKSTVSRFSRAAITRNKAPQFVFCTFIKSKEIPVTNWFCSNAWARHPRVPVHTIQVGPNANDVDAR